MSDSLIVMARPPVLGRVKTRLAASIGDENALKIYEKLLAHTLMLTEQSQLKTYLYLSEASDYFDNRSFHIRVQNGDELGERMQHAFEEVFAEGEARVLMIGTDCPGLQLDHLDKAIEILSKKDVVLGPATDGGYYLIGMKKMLPMVFEEMPWSTPNLFNTTLDKIQSHFLSVGLLSTLSDVDSIEDLPAQYMDIE